MINEEVILSVNTNMTRRHEDTTDTVTTDDNDNNVNDNDRERNGNKRTSPNRSLDLPKYGAIRKQLSPEKFVLDSPVPDLPTPVNEDAETTEFWAKLRCGARRTEEVAEREKQKQEIIKNELHNIMRSQLKRVDGEMNAFSSRVKEFDKHLEESENYIRQATSALADVVALQAEEDKSQNEDNENESNLSAFDQHVLFLETQLRDAKMKASLSFQILEDCDQAQESLFSPVSSPSNPSVTAAGTLKQSSNPTTSDIANGNTEPGPPPRNSRAQLATKEMEENIANGNVTTGNEAFTDTLCQGTIEVEENIQNGNVTRDILNSLKLKNSNMKSLHESKIITSNNNNRNGNANCFSDILSEDSANANLPL